MATFGLTAANDIASAALIFYVREEMLSQTTTDKPLLKWLKSGSKSFEGGNLQISLPVQINFMSDTAGFLQGYNQDDAANVLTASNMLRAAYTWKELISMLAITWTDLKIDGITIVDDTKGGSVSEHSNTALTRLTSILKNRMSDFGESWARATTTMWWQDGSQDAKQPAGIPAFITDAPALGSTGGLSRVTYAAWRNRASLALAPSAQNSTLIQFLNSELVQLRRFGGKPNKALCGSAWLDALRLELFAKGYFTMQGFQGDKATDLGMGGLHITGMGKFEYDPFLDQLGMSKRCYILDGSKIRIQPMEQEDNKVLTPERPYNYMLYLYGMTWTGCMTCNQLNGNGVYSIQ